MKTLVVGAYWPMRNETRSDCAIRLLRTMHRLREVHNELSHWYRTASRKAAARLSPIKSDASMLEVELRQNRRDTDRVPIAELGYYFDAWNGNFEIPASIGVHCGCFSKFVGNAAVLNLPLEIIARDAAVSDRVHKILIEEWEAETGVIERLDGVRQETNLV